MRDLDDLLAELVSQIKTLNERIDELERQPAPMFAFKNLAFGQMRSNSGDAARWLRIASLPASTAATGDSLLIHFIGGQVSSSQQFHMLIRAGNRAAFNAYIQESSGDLTQITHARLVAYSNGGVATFYLTLPGTTWAFVAATVMTSGWGTQPTLYPGEQETTSTPAGALVFDSATATSLLSQSNAGDLYSVAWTDYSATSTITGWSGFTVKIIRYKKIGKLMWVAFQIAGPSDAATVSFTLPYTAAASGLFEFPILVVDNGVTAATPGRGLLLVGASTVNCYKDYTGAAWTASGTKQARGEFWYEAT